MSNVRFEGFPHLDGVINLRNGVNWKLLPPEKKEKKNGDRSTGAMQLSATTGSLPRFISSQVCEACFDAVFRSYRFLLKELKKELSSYTSPALSSCSRTPFLFLLS